MARCRNNSRKTYKGILFASIFEKNIAELLDKLKVKWEYEQWYLDYYLDLRNANCSKCGCTEIKELHTYTPDFYLPKYDFFIEAKGRWTGADRNKHRAIHNTYPDHHVDIRFVFQYDNWLTSRKSKKYSEYCEKQQWLYSIGDIPLEWLK